MMTKLTQLIRKMQITIAMFLFVSLLGGRAYAQSAWASNNYLGEWKLVLVSSTYDSASNTTAFVYSMTEMEADPAKDLSHWYLPLPDGATLVSVSKNSGNVSWEHQYYANCEATCLKYDASQSVASTAQYSFTLAGEYTTTTGSYYVKAGSGDLSVAEGTTDVPAVGSSGGGGSGEEEEPTSFEWNVRFVERSYDAEDNLTTYKIDLLPASDSDDANFALVNYFFSLDALGSFNSMESSLFGNLVYTSGTFSDYGSNTGVEVTGTVNPNQYQRLELVFSGDYSQSSTNFYYVMASGSGTAVLDLTTPYSQSTYQYVEPTANDCPVVVDYMGDKPVAEYIKARYGYQEHLPTVLEGIGIVSAETGEAINTGASLFSVDTLTGSIIPLDTPAIDPNTSEQLQIQRFLATRNVELELTYSGLGGAGYRSHFGVYYYPASDAENNVMIDAGTVSYKHLFTQNITPKGSTVSFSIPEDHFFGFYLIANGIASTGLYYTENRFNSDNYRVKANDEQRPGGVTDHFVFFNSNLGFVTAVEDLKLNNWNYLLGDQDFEDLVLTGLRCASGVNIDVGTFNLDTGTPQSASLAGLESNGDLSAAYAMREFITKGYRSGLSLSSAPSGKITGVDASSSQLRDVSVYKDSGFALSQEPVNSVLKETLLGAVSNPGNGLKAMDFTPQDIPFVSNARFGVGVNYYGSNDRHQASLFATITDSQLYNHAKGVCDRAKGASISDLGTTQVGGNNVYFAKTRNERTNRQEYAMLFSYGLNDKNEITEFVAPWSFASLEHNESANYMNFQVWAATKLDAEVLAWEVIKSIEAKLAKKSMKRTPVKSPDAYLQKISVENRKVMMTAHNNTKSNQTVTVHFENIRKVQGGEYEKDVVKTITLTPGRNYIEHQFNHTVFDLTVEVKKQASGFVDSVYLLTGAYTYFNDAPQGGKSKGEMTAVDCGKVAPSYDSPVREIPGCVEFKGFTDAYQGIYRSLFGVSVELYDTLVFEKTGKTPVSVCLETDASQYFCEKEVIDGENIVDIVELVKRHDKDVLSLSKVTAISFHVQERSVDTSFGIGNMKLMKNRVEWSAAAFDVAEAVSPEELFHDGQELLLATWENDSWKVWSSSATFEAHVWGMSEGVERISEIAPGKSYFIASYYGYVPHRVKVETKFEMQSGWNFYPHTGKSTTIADFKEKNPGVQRVWFWNGQNWEVAFGHHGRVKLESLNQGSAYWIYHK